jgi:hypothetical protein
MAYKIPLDDDRGGQESFLDVNQLPGNNLFEVITPLVINSPTSVPPKAPLGATIKNMIPQQYEFAPALGTATAILNAYELTTSGSSSAEAVGMANVFMPDYPRLLNAVANASGVTGNVVISFKDFADAIDTFTLAMNGLTPVVGTKAVKQILAVTVPGKTHAGDKISIGTENVFGFPKALTNAKQVIEADFNGSADLGTVAATGIVDTTLFTPAGTPDGTTKIRLTYLV